MLFCYGCYAQEPSGEVLDTQVTTVYSSGKKNTREITLQQFYRYAVPPEMKKKWVMRADNEWCIVTNAENKEISFLFMINPAKNEAILSQVSIDGKDLLVYEKDRFFNQFVYRAEENIMHQSGGS